MPLTEKGQEIMANMKKQYGEKRGEQVFYASKNKGNISGVDRRSRKTKDAQDLPLQTLHDALVGRLAGGQPPSYKVTRDRMLSTKDGCGCGGTRDSTGAFQVGEVERPDKKSFAAGVRDALAKGVALDRALGIGLRQAKRK
jgi:hypothetical protein